MDLDAHMTPVLATMATAAGKQTSQRNLPLSSRFSRIARRIQPKTEFRVTMSKESVKGRRRDNAVDRTRSRRDAQVDAKRGNSSSSSGSTKGKQKQGKQQQQQQQQQQQGKGKGKKGKQQQQQNQNQNQGQKKGKEKVQDKKGKKKPEPTKKLTKDDLDAQMDLYHGKDPVKERLNDDMDAYWKGKKDDAPAASEE